MTTKGKLNRVVFPAVSYEEAEAIANKLRTEYEAKGATDFQFKYNHDARKGFVSMMLPLVDIDSTGETVSTD
jgi:hypothetical protein